MLLATDIGLVMGSAGTLIASAVGLLAFFQKKRTDREAAALAKQMADEAAALAQKSITREEVQQAFDLQDLAMKEVKETNASLTAEIARVRGKNDAMHDTLNSTFAKMAELKAEHTRCQTDLNRLGHELRTVRNHLHIAEAKIAELGG